MSQGYKQSPILCPRAPVCMLGTNCMLPLFIALIQVKASAPQKMRRLQPLVEYVEASPFEGVLSTILCVLFVCACAFKQHPIPVCVRTISGSTLHEGQRAC